MARHSLPRAIPSASNVARSLPCRTALLPCLRPSVRHKSSRTLQPIETDVRGVVLLNSPRLNKARCSAMPTLTRQGAAFTREERGTFGLEGMLPHAVHTLEEQLMRAKEQARVVHSPMLTVHRSTSWTRQS